MTSELLYVYPDGTAVRNVTLHLDSNDETTLVNCPRTGRRMPCLMLGWQAGKWTFNDMEFITVNAQGASSDDNTPLAARGGTGRSRRGGRDFLIAAALSACGADCPPGYSLGPGQTGCQLRFPRGGAHSIRGVRCDRIYICHATIFTTSLEEVGYDGLQDRNVVEAEVLSAGG